MLPTTVRLLKDGLDRVLNGAVGMEFEVDHFSLGVSGRVAHVIDPRYDNGGRPQTWSIAAYGYEVVA